MIRWVKGILYRDGKVLIAKLRKADPLINRIVWTFPYIQLSQGQSPRKAAKKLFEEDLSFKNIKIDKFLIKHVPSENAKIEQYYYRIDPGIGNPIPCDKFSEYTWVNPTQVLKYFTTSINKELMHYLRSLEKTGKGIIIE